MWKTLTFVFGVLFLMVMTETIHVNKPTSSIRNKNAAASATSAVPKQSPLPSAPVKEDNDAAAKETTKQVVTESEPQTEASKEPAETNVSSISEPTVAERHAYRRRGQPMTDDDRKAMVDKWGSWTLVDEKERPNHDYYAIYPNRDIPRSDFPENAWQTDQEYLAKFLPESIKLVERTQEAILAEYGLTEGSWEERTEMFSLEMFDTLEGTSPYVITKPETGWRKDTQGERGGWSTTKSWEGLKRRLLHAIMTEDSFIFAMGGHSAAAGHGNLFQQSYSIQLQWIMEAVFARLGVRHVAKNFANGGLGTIQHGLAAASVYGPAIDMLMWDSSMTEGDGPSIEVFARQGLIGGVKVPVLWGLKSDVSKPFNMGADVDVGMLGRGTYGLKKAEKFEDLESIPWAARYMKCDGDLNEVCGQNKYTAHCWDENRTDVAPPTKQAGFPGGRAKWHPGSREHQLQGRVLTFTILQALKEALVTWSEVDNFELPDDQWHLTEWYDIIRSKLEALGPGFGFCHEEADNDLDWVCRYPVKGRTEFTPRAFPSLSNIRSLMPPEMAANVPESARPLYNPPEQFIPELHPPPGAVDVLNIVEAGIDFKSTLNPDYAVAYYKKPTFEKPSSFTFGKGIGLYSRAGDEFCDGTADAFCGKGPEDNCLLAGTNDYRGGLILDGYSGWTVLNLPELKYGYIALKFECWHKEGENPQTKDWASENNESTSRRLGDPTKYCEKFEFQYAIDGKMTTMNREEFVLERKKKVQRVVEIITILKDPDYTGGVEKEVELAFRITGCGQQKTFFFSHVYWA